jgi:hypothetical protein
MLEKACNDVKGAGYYISTYFSTLKKMQIMSDRRGKDFSFESEIVKNVNNLLNQLDTV